MIVTPIKTTRITARQITLTDLLDKSVDTLDENSVIAITSKVVSLCEGTVIPVEGTDKEALIKQESDHYLPKEFSAYGHHFSIKNNTLIATAGIDESNGNGYHVLWPRDPQATANSVREYLANRFNIQNIGVIITDSTSQPLRLGTIGISLAHSGFQALRDYTGTSDLFGRPFTQNITRSNHASGLAAAAVVTMGEGAESTPFAIITDIPFVQFQSHNPTRVELDDLAVTLENDLFAPFLGAVNWQSSKH